MIAIPIKTNETLELFAVGLEEGLGLIVIICAVLKLTKKEVKINKIAEDIKIEKQFSRTKLGLIKT